MDVGDLSNATAVAGSGTNFTINNNTIISTANIINNNNTPNIYANAGWWTPNSTIVTAPSNADVVRNYNSIKNPKEKNKINNKNQLYK